MYCNVVRRLNSPVKLLSVLIASLCIDRDSWQRTKNIFLEPYKHKDDLYEAIQFENYPYLSKVWSILGEGSIITLRVAGVPCRGCKTGEIGTGESWGTSIYLSKKDWIKYRLFISLMNVEINLEVKRLMNI